MSQKQATQIDPIQNSNRTSVASTTANFHATPIGDKDVGFDNCCVNVRTLVEQGFRCSRRELSELSFLLRLTSE